MFENERILEEEADDDLITVLTATIAAHEQHIQSTESRRGGSVINHRVIYRNRAEGNERLYRDYFANNCTYPEHIFRRRFRMRRSLFLRIQAAVESRDSYFVQRRNAAGNLGLSSLQKITAALRMLAYGVAADAVDDYIRIGESTAIESLRRFVKAVIDIFGDEYLRRPNNADIARLKEKAEERGFPGMLGSIDCMHWKWKNCPTAWHGTYTGHVREPTIILEAIASHDLWFWHAHFGLPGSLNDINVLDRSHIFDDLAAGRAPEVRYTINDHEYTMGYYLADGIYPSWSTFVKTISSPQGNKNALFSSTQEAYRKDVERAFGVLQARFAIIRGPSRFWDLDTLKNIMTTCIVLHNMIVEDEREIGQNDFNYDATDVVPTITVSRDRTNDINEFFQMHYRIRNRHTHNQLQADLVEHLWQLHGRN